MDPISSCGLGANALQLLEHVGKLIKVAESMRESPDGMPTAMREMEVAATDLLGSVDLIPAPSTPGDDKTLEAICTSSRDLANQLLKSLGTLKRVNGMSKRMIIQDTFRTLHVEHETKALQSRLSELRLQLITHLTARSRQDQRHIMTVVDSIAERIGTIEGKVDSIDHSDRLVRLGYLRSESILEVDPNSDQPAISLSTATEELEIGSKAEEAPETPTEFIFESSIQAITRPAQALARLTQPSIRINAPSRFRCNNADCACACHLDRYVRTPLFLKRFFGALAFRGACRSHASTLWELKYWIPEWVSNYNVYLLFERNASGSPCLGLKFQRKVPWGGADSVLRFSYVGDVQGILSLLGTGLGSLDDIDPNHGRSALHYAVMRNHVSACKVLLQAGADRFIEDESQMSATQKAWEHIFTKRGAPEVLDAYKILFPADEFDYWLFPPLHKAILGIEGFLLPQLLGLESIASYINDRDARQRTALHWAALRGDLRAVERLLEAGAEVDAVDEFECTPLLYAVSVAVPRIVEILLLSGADVHATNRRGDSPLHYAARHKDDLETVKILIRAGAQVDRKNHLGNTPFTGAAVTNRVASGMYLLRCGADRYSKNKYGDSPLRETIHHNCHEFLQMLLKEKTRCDDINMHGSTLLHAVALEGDTRTVQILKSAGIGGLDVRQKNSRGETAMDIYQKRIGAPESFGDTFLEFLSAFTPVLQP